MTLPAPPLSPSSSMTTLSISSLESTIQRMLSHPQTFNGFIDILKLPAVQATLSSLTNGASSDPQKQRRHDALIRTVELFAYGTVGEYHDLIDTAARGGSHQEVWTLNEVMLEKLRMLTVVSTVSRRVNGGDDDTRSTKCGGGDDVEMKMADAALCERTVSMHAKKTRNTQITVMGESKKDSNRSSNSRRKSPSRADAMLSIPYSRLALEMRMPYQQHGMTNDGDDKIQDTKHIRQLEDLLIKCIYSNIISAKLDQLTQCLIVQPHLMLVEPDGDVVGWETFFAPSSSSSVDVDYKSWDERKGVVGGGREGEGLAQGAVYSSILSRDLHTITPEATVTEITRMSSSLQRFLSRSNSLLETLERLSDTTVVKHRKEDEGRWAEVRKVVEEAPSRMRDMASPSTQSAFASSSYSTAAISACPGIDDRGMRVGWVMGRGGTSGGNGSGGSGGENLTEVVEVIGRRQVKRSKGGHSMMMNIMGGGGV